MQRLVLAFALAATMLAPRVAAAQASPEPAPEPAPAPEAAPAPEPAPAPAPATSDAPVTPAPRGRDILIEVPGERTMNNKLVLGGMLAAGVIAGALGVYWHLDSRDASNAVEADEFTGEAWSPAHAAEVDRAERSKTRATVAYSIGGAFVVGTVVAYILSEPKSETTVIRTGATIAPTRDGAVVSKAWSF